MSFIHALILGLVQGLTEFFPVSSSAHLELTRKLLGITERPVMFDLCCHFGTLFALLLFFRREITALFTSQRSRIPLFILALVPLIPAYFLLRPLRMAIGHPHALFLIATGLILFTGERLRFSLKISPVRDALLIGTLQATALIPGISRSASTISCARVLGWKPSEAVRFSFLLSIPTVIGGNLLELIKSGPKEPISVSLCLVGGLCALLTGLVVIRFAMHYLEQGKLKPFAWYCLGLGVVAWALL